MCKCMVVFLPTLQCTILRMLRYLLRGLSDDGTSDMLKHVGDLLSLMCIYFGACKLVM